MNIYASVSQFSLLILTYWLISEVFTVLFRLIGLPAEKARFQVISLLTGCGFTTRESEMILSNRSRRRLARITMLFGFVFNVTIVSSLINVFLSIQITELSSRLLSLLIPLAAVSGILILSRVGAIRSRLDRLIERLAGRITGNAASNSIVQIDQLGKESIVQLTLHHVPQAFKDIPLSETGLKSEQGILVMLVEHGGRPAQAADADTVFVSGDRLTLFGSYQTICQTFEAKEYFSAGED